VGKKQTCSEAPADAAFHYAVYLHGVLVVVVVVITILFSYIWLVLESRGGIMV
jgi:hypothetical protein